MKNSIFPQETLTSAIGLKFQTRVNGMTMTSRNSSIVLEWTIIDEDEDNLTLECTSVFEDYLEPQYIGTKKIISFDSLLYHITVPFNSGDYVVSPYFDRDQIAKYLKTKIKYQ